MTPKTRFLPRHTESAQLESSAAMLGHRDAAAERQGRDGNRMTIGGILGNILGARGASAFGSSHLAALPMFPTAVPRASALDALVTPLRRTAR